VRFVPIQLLAYTQKLGYSLCILDALALQLNSLPRLPRSSNTPKLPLTITFSTHRLASTKITHLEQQLNPTFKFHALTPILSATPPWHPPPTINLSLAQYSKDSTPSSVFKSLFQELIRSLHQLTLCFTDDSETHDRIGFAYLIHIFPQRILNLLTKPTHCYIDKISWTSHDHVSCFPYIFPSPRAYMGGEA